ncbi:MAG: hypothetical protein ABI548_25660 [Polyangiaceae bacterium]
MTDVEKDPTAEGAPEQPAPAQPEQPAPAQPEQPAPAQPEQPAPAQPEQRAVPQPEQPKVDTTRDLSKDEIAARLRLVNPELAKEVYEIAKAQVQSEAARHTRLDAKANSVITAAGLSMAVASSLGGIIASGQTLLPGWLLWMFGLAGIFALSSVVTGVMALLVKGGYAQVSDHAVFNQEKLAFADVPTGCDDLLDAKDKQAYGVAVYRQYMAAHLWDVSVKDHGQLNRKAKQVQVAQWLFIAFLVVLLACELLMFREISSQHHARKTAAARPATSQGAVRRQRLASAGSAQAAL